MNKKLEKIRMTGGIYKGRTIIVPEVAHAMGAREKLALFNMIGPYLPGASVLDAYAGSGALGLEALSRGVKSVHFVDNSAEAVRTIRENLAALGASGEVMRGDILKITGKTMKKYDIVMADPPYDRYKPEMITCLAPMVAEGGILATSTPCEGPEITGLEKLRARKYAAAHITIYHRRRHEM